MGSRPANTAKSTSLSGAIKAHCKNLPLLFLILYAHAFFVSTRLIFVKNFIFYPKKDPV